jgi:hypothetical protein
MMAARLLVKLMQVPAALTQVVAVVARPIIIMVYKMVALVQVAAVL